MSHKTPLPLVEDAHLSEYLALRQKVDLQVEQITTSRPLVFACRPGCESCCLVSLTLSAVEAAALLEGLQSRAQRDENYRASLAAQIANSGQPTSSAEAAPAAGTEQPHGADQPRCVLLDDAGRCQLYEARPLVCRTQGLALRYPSNVVPVEAVRATMTGAGEISHRSLVAGPISDGEDALVWCPLNYDGIAAESAQSTEGAEKTEPMLPSPREVLDASRIDALSGLVNHRYCEQTKQDRNQRWSLRQVVTAWLGAC